MVNEPRAAISVGLGRREVPGALSRSHCIIDNSICRFVDLWMVEGEDLDTPWAKGLPNLLLSHLSVAISD